MSPVKRYLSIIRRSILSTRSMAFVSRILPQLHLMQGPITVFDQDAYAGDARIGDLAPGQERLISYALDLNTEVEALPGTGQQDVVAVSIRKGTLLATRKLVEKKTYHVKNRDQKTKTVLIEHPFRANWQLTEPQEPTERTRDVYRFTMSLAPEAKISLPVREEKHIQQTIRLVDAHADRIAYYLQAKQISSSVKEALQQVVTLQDRLSQTRSQRSRLEQSVKTFSQEQARIRDNMARLSQSSSLFARYVEKLDQQETAIEDVQQEIERLKDAENRQKRALNDFLLGLDVQ